MSPRPRVDHLRRPQIISAAAQVLYERGLFDSRIGDIAEQAGTSPATILYYFESKDRLLEEAVDQSDRDFYARLTEGQARHDCARDKLVHLIEETSRGPGGLSDYTLWMEMWVRARRDDAVRNNYFRLNTRERELIADIVRAGQQDGEFSADADPDNVALMLSGLMDGLGVQVTLGQPDVTPERMIDRCLALASTELGCKLQPSGAVTGALENRRGPEQLQHQDAVSRGGELACIHVRDG